jgi:DNA-binding response OmpR family regulator
MLLDVLLPHMDGLEVCRILRAESLMPIIMLTSCATDEDKLTGLALGADDYVTKPFGLRELLTRIRVVLRRTMRTRAPAPLELELAV